MVAPLMLHFTQTQTRRIISVVAFLLASPSLFAFIIGHANNIFVNGTRGDVRLKYASTAIKVDKPVVIRYGSGLAMSNDNGQLLQFTVIYATSKVLHLSAKDIRRIEASSTFKNGVWWINDDGVEYISTKQSLSRKKSIFGRW